MRFTGLIAIVVVTGACVLSCSQPGSLSIRLSPPDRSLAARPVAPTADTMDCYFASVDYGGIAAAGVPSCFGLSRTSSLGTFAAVTTAGLTLKAPLGFHRRVRIWGVGTAGACSGKTAVSELFVGGARPSVFPIADENVNFVGAARVSLNSNYVVGVSPNTGACDGPAPTVGAISVSVGLYRGGVVVPILGSGFEIGARANIGGVDCKSTNFISSTEIQCITPRNTPAEGLAVVVRNPNLIPVTSPTNYTARALLLAGAGTSSRTYDISSYGVNPTTGALSLIDTKTILAGSVLGARLAVHPSGRWIAKAVSAGGGGGIAISAVDPITGALSAPVITSSADPAVIDFSPDGNYLVVIQGIGGKSRTVFSFDAATGALSPITQIASTVIVSGGVSFAFKKDGTILYAVLSASPSLAAWSLSATGQLADIAALLPTNFPAFIYPLKGRDFFLFESSTPPLLAELSSTDGSLTTQDSSISTASLISSSPDGSFAHVLLSSSTVVPIFVGPTGLMSQGTAVIAETSSVIALTADPSGKFLGVGDNGATPSKAVGLYAIDGATGQIGAHPVSATSVPTPTIDSLVFD